MMLPAANPVDFFRPPAGHLAGQTDRLENWLSPVVMAYGLGILVANLHLFPVDQQLSTRLSEVTVLLAIPMLLFSTDIAAWLKYASKTLISFGLCILSGLVASTLVALFFPLEGLDNWLVSGMLVGVYTGGTPNMQAIGLALEADQEVYVLLYAADIFCGGLYLLFLTSIAHRCLGLFLPDFEGDKGLGDASQNDASSRIDLRQVGQGFVFDSPDHCHFGGPGVAPYGRPQSQQLDHFYS